MKWIIALVVVLQICMPVAGEEPLIVAHRGASRDAPENTIPAFQLAWEQGADAIEGDFHLTKDGKIVCIHDGNTKKVAGRKLVVRQSTLAELRELDVGAYRGELFKGTTIPTLAEVFATVPDRKKIYIEVKCGAEILPVLLKEIHASGLRKEQIVVISFKEEVIRGLKAKAVQFKAYWLSGFKKDESGKVTPSVQRVLNTLEEINADGFSSSQSVINQAYIQRVLEKGYEYHVWTVDDVQTARRFRNWGARSITTNVPGIIRKQFAEKSE